VYLNAVSFKGKCLPISALKRNKKLRFSFLVKLDSTSQFLFFENIFYLFYFGWKVIFLLAWLRPHQYEWGTTKVK
jgi:hypothetical protein